MCDGPQGCPIGEKGVEGPPGVGHWWTGAPDVHCRLCGNSSHLEDAVICMHCHVPSGPDDDQTVRLCEFHQQWADAMATCPPDPEKVKAINFKLGNRSS